MTPTDLKTKVLSLHSSKTVAQIAEECGVSICRVRQRAKALGVRCKKFSGSIRRHHDYIIELSKTKTPAEVAKIVGFSLGQIYSYIHRHGIMCQKALPPRRKNYKDGCVRALTNGPTGEQITLNIIRLAGYKPVYAINKTQPNGRDIIFNGKYQIGENLVLPNYEAVEKFAAAL